MKKVRKQGTTKTEVLVVVSENTPNPLANNVDFMRALHDFQYGEGETSDRGFEQMGASLKKPLKK